MNKASILVTGFEPFNGDSVNPSWLIAQQLHGELILDTPVVAGAPAAYFSTLSIQATALVTQQDLCVSGGSIA